jgi:hypothetical protein
MAHTQITDLNLSKIELCEEFCEEITDEELLQVQGGGLGRSIKKSL